MGMIVQTKRILTALITISSLIWGMPAQAQPTANKPTSVTQTPAATGQVATLPGNYGGGTPINFVRIFEARGPYTSVSAFDAAASGTNGYQNVKQTTDYLDGLGRPIQTVARQASAGSSPKDLVTPTIYDAMGRVSIQYLPYLQTTTSASDGLFKTNAFAEQDYFYKNVYKDANNQLMLPGEAAFYSRTVYEPSPLNRVSKQFAPGNTWAGSYNPSSPGGEKAIQQLYRINTTEDAVQIWDVGYDALSFTGNELPGNLNLPVKRSAYSAGTLSKNITIDEAGNAVVEYKDKSGLVILKKVQIGTIASDYSGYSGFLSTYYVYDDLGRLRFVIPPKAVEAISGSSWSITTDIANELCFRYEYDQRNRMRAKKVPGAGWAYMVYDVRDRLVFTQDANMRAVNQWMATLYDRLNRAVITGILTYSGNLDALQTAVNTQTATPGSPNTSLLVDLVLDNPNTSGVHQAIRSISMEDDFETTTSGEFTGELVAGPGGADGETTAMEGLAINKNPLPSGAPFVPLTITYYDNYDWTSKAYTTTYNAQVDAGNNLHAEALPATASNKTIGLVTGTKLRALENPANLATGKWLTSVTFFDDKNRPVQIISDNYRGATDLMISRYDFTGKVLTTYQLLGLSGQRIKTNMEYDAGGRLLETWKTINDETAKKALIAKNSYDALGNLLTKELGQKRDISGNYTSTPLEILNQTYNVRGWLAGINKDYANGQSSGDSRYFGMELNYDWGFGGNQYNGNIGGTKWRSKGDGERRSYGFTYDAANRILGADFGQYSSGSYTDHASISFDMQMGNGSSASTAYDANGNILAMKQWGLKATSSDVIDNLTYTYLTNSNKLKNVLDATNDADTKLGDFRTSTIHLGHGTRDASVVDYTYDVNGNLKKDLNKDIGTTGADGIEYNHLNLPYRITMRNSSGTTKGTITYIYDAAGTKLEKRVEEYNTAGTEVILTAKTLYQSGTVYESKADKDDNTPDYTDKLQFIGMEEGRVRPQWDGVNITGYVYDYMIKDHLGNVRMLLTDEKKVDIYPAATLEGTTHNGGTAISKEDDYYAIDMGYVVSNPSGIPAYQNNNGNPPPNNNPYSNVTANSEKVYRVNATENKTGLGIVLKVMAGDRIDILGKSWYEGSATYNNANSTTLTLNEIMSSLLGTPNNAGLSGKGLTATNLATLNGGGALASFIRGSNGESGAVPKAYINFIFLDEQFKYVSGNASRVGSSGSVKDHWTVDAGTLQNISVSKSGYLYVYVSNESNANVYFDNLQVMHTRGPILEETHYYPFGLTMAGISGKASEFGKPENRYKYNGIEKESDLGIEIYDAQLRELDGQIARWWQVDPKTENMEMWSPYASNYDNPIRYSDPLGDEGQDCCQWLTDAIDWVADKTKQAVQYTGGLAIGTAIAIYDNVTNSNIRSELAPTFEGTGAAGHGWNAGLNTGDGASLLIGVTEMGVGTGMAGTGGATLVASGGASAPVSVPLVAQGTAITAHGYMTTNNAAQNLLSQNGRVNANSSASSGRGTQNPKVREAVQTGQKAHKEFGQKAKDKGWTVEPTLKDPLTGKNVKPDAVTPSGRPVELKPNTASGKAKGATQLPKYERATGQKGRVVTYDPSKYKQ